MYYTERNRWTGKLTQIKIETLYRIIEFENKNPNIWRRHEIFWISQNALNIFENIRISWHGYELTREFLSAYEAKFFVILFRRAFKMMKNGVYFIVHNMTPQVI